MKMYFVKYHGATCNWPVYNFKSDEKELFTIAVSENEFNEQMQEVLFFTVEEAKKFAKRYKKYSDGNKVTIDFVEVEEDDGTIR